MATTTTRTLNPLPFGDMEPHRFEDLVRQLAYDFRRWNKLEATGRSGGDEGFDARGWEIVPFEGVAEDTEDTATDDEAGAPQGEDRLWLIQCKREKKIGPTKLVEYLDDISESERGNLHGALLAAPCNFSKKSRDAFTVKCRDFGIQECHLWGMAELEDMLFQPKNDHLLFAYFGISLQIRRRSVRTALRARLATKRQAHVVLSEMQNAYVLLRDPTDNRYPRRPASDDSDGPRRWGVYTFAELAYAGLAIVLHRHFAYLSDATDAWDYVPVIDDAVPNKYDDYWSEREKNVAVRERVWKFWNDIPEHNRAWYELLGLIEYDDILAIDKLGDELFRGPHIYVVVPPGEALFRRTQMRVQPADVYSSRRLIPSSLEDRRTKFFPDDFPPVAPAEGG